MAEIIAQASFNSGEWAPNLFSRVDLQKYRSGAALLENFYIDYRGGASTRPGTRYILQAYKSSTPVRIITFQASFNVGYVLEFGQEYLRFYYQGSPVLENSFAITGATQANPAVLTIPGHDYLVGDWIWVVGVVGMTQLNGRYFSISATTGTTVTLADLNGVPINSTAYTAYVSGGTAQRVYTIATPYQATDLALLKFAQYTNEMVLCHPSYVPYLLSLVTAIDWTLAPIVFGSTAAVPTGVVATSTLGAGTTNYSYVVTSIDANGQESGPSAPASLTNLQDIRTVAGSNMISFPPAANAVGYNFYESSVSYFGVVPSGVSYGFIGTSTSPVFIDSNIGQDFSESPPVYNNPFVGDGVAFVSVTAPGAYATVPTVSFTGGTPSIPATAIAVLQVLATPPITAGGTGFVVGDTVTFLDGLVLTVTAVATGAITAWSIAAPGAIYSGGTPGNPMSQIGTSGHGTGAEASPGWGVGQVDVLTSGAGYTATPTVVFSAGAAAATATLTPTSTGNPSVPSFFQQRLVLAAPSGAPETFYMSQPGGYFNFNTSNPVEPADSITETLVSGTLNTIKSIVSATAGMLILTDQVVWLVNGGSSGSGVSPTAIVANPQSYVGANDVPPIKANWSVLHVQAKGAAVRELAYNIYFNVFTGSDISITSSHLFFSYEILQWAWAEAPFYVVWAVRSDGVMLTLTFLKEQEFIGWTHQTTTGEFKSVCAVTEITSDAGAVDAIYTVVQRVVNGNTIQYIERVADRAFPSGLSSAWCVDSGVQYTGAPELGFTGAEHLAGLTVTGLATDNLGNVTIITPFVMSISGDFTLPAPTPAGATGYTTVTVGLGFVASLQTLAIDTSHNQIQGKLKKIPHVDARVVDTLGLTIGADFNHLTPMKDLVQGNVSSMLTGQQNQVVDGLYTGDARTFLGPTYTVPGQYCIQQPNPYPATITGVFPLLVVEDDP
jgi:hypothetical protein